MVYCQFSHPNGRRWDTLVHVPQHAVHDEDHEVDVVDEDDLVDVPDEEYDVHLNEFLELKRADDEAKLKADLAELDKEFAEEEAWIAENCSDDEEFAEEEAWIAENFSDDEEFEFGDEGSR